MKESWRKPLKRWAKAARIAFLVQFRFRPLHTGRGFYVGPHVWIAPNTLNAGDHVFIGSHSYLAVPTQLGNFVMLASFVSIVGGDHRTDVPGTPMIFSGRACQRPVRIEDDVWIGQGVTIMHGVTIEEGCIVAAGAVVTHDLPAYSIAAGIPAQVIRNRFSQEQRQQHAAVLAEYRRTNSRLPHWRYVDGNEPL